MIQCDCNIKVVSRIQLVVNKNFFHLQFFDLIVKKYEINNIPKCTSFWHEINVQNCVGFWSSAPDPAGGAYDTPPNPLVGRGFLPSAIACNFAPSALAISPTPMFICEKLLDFLLPRVHPLGTYSTSVFHLQYVPLLKVP